MLLLIHLLYVAQTTALAECHVDVPISQSIPYLEDSIYGRCDPLLEVLPMEKSLTSRGCCQMKCSHNIHGCSLLNTIRRSPLPNVQPQFPGLFIRLQAISPTKVGHVQAVFRQLEDFCQ